ncbi:MAG: glycosyltransferase [Chlorobiaceae bacterium]|nr:glycosyltransferase [Chlorobiaceae bacterium]
MSNKPDILDLTIIPSVSLWKEGDVLVFDRKFYDGIIQYVEKWPGKITCVMRLGSSVPPAFGLVKKRVEELPFGCVTLKDDEPICSLHIRNASIVLASADAHDQLHISSLCRQAGVKCIYVIEYIPETRYQIAALETGNPLLLLRRLFYLWRQEQKRNAAFGLSDGLQSNGTPAYEYYKNCPNRMFYFDTRVFRRHMIAESDLARRLDLLSLGKPIRLAFSGRLISMKGADHLVRLALMLKRKGLSFSFVIYGAGELESEMKSFISRNALDSEVSMPGSVDFYTALLPEIQNNVDLFVCLHRQSDPSCTYMETLACGVPIVGYKNRAFAGILELADIGWGAAMNDIESIAGIIVRLNENRAEIAEKSGNSISFAGMHDFETTFQNRIGHLISSVQ